MAQRRFYFLDLTLNDDPYIVSQLLIQPGTRDSYIDTMQGAVKYCDVIGIEWIGDSKQLRFVIDNRTADPEIDNDLIHQVFRQFNIELISSLRKDE